MERPNKVKKFDDDVKFETLHTNHILITEHTEDSQLSLERCYEAIFKLQDRRSKLYEDWRNAKNPEDKQFAVDQIAAIQSQIGHYQNRIDQTINGRKKKGWQKLLVLGLKCLVVALGLAGTIVAEGWDTSTILLFIAGCAALAALILQ